MTVVYNTTDAMAVGNVTAQLVNSDGGFVPVGPLLSVPAHEDGSWSIELAPNDASVGFSSVWYVTMHQENVPPTSWYLDVPADGPVFVGALDSNEAPNQGINVEQIQAGSGISIDPPDGTGIVTITNTGGGGQLPVYSTAANIEMTSTAGNVDLTAVGNLTLSGSTIALDYGAGNYQYILIADNAGNLPGPGVNVPALGYTANDALQGGASNGASAQFVWNTTFDEWQPVPQNIGNVTVQTYNRGGASYTNLEVCPWYNAQPVGLVSTATPRGADIYPFATLAPGDNIGVLFLQTLQLLAAGSIAVPGWDYVDIAGTVTVWDAAGTNLLEASFSWNQIHSDTPSSQSLYNLTQVRLVGLDLNIVTVYDTNDSIQTTAGGAYNIATNVYASWD